MRTKKIFNLVSFLVILALFLAACSPKPPETVAPPAAEAPADSAPVAAADPMEELIAAAKAEGTLTVIALPHDWCNYGEAIEGFKAKYGIKVNELNPDAGSADDEMVPILAEKWGSKIRILGWFNRKLSSFMWIFIVLGVVDRKSVV